MIYFKNNKYWCKLFFQVRRSMRVFPQPYFDRPIYDQMENCPRGLRHSCSSTFLYLKRLFHEVLRTGDWERLPVANSLRKLRLENTKAGWNIVYPPPLYKKLQCALKKEKNFINLQKLLFGCCWSWTFNIYIQCGKLRLKETVYQ